MSDRPLSSDLGFMGFCLWCERDLKPEEGGMTAGGSRTCGAGDKRCPPVGWPRGE